MGTNYYTDGTLPCKHCGRSGPALHIGKSSVGWRFLFASYPEHDIKSAKDWREFLDRAGVLIFDEYGDEVAPDTFWQLVEEKQSCPTHDDQFRGHGGRSRFESDDAEGYRISHTADFS